MKLQKLEITNFKVFEDVSLSMNGRSVIFFGMNGAGKSTILSAICNIFRVFLFQLTPAQSKAFGKFNDDMIHQSADHLGMKAIIDLDENHSFLLERQYNASKKNKREAEPTFSRSSYAKFKDSFEKMYLSSDDDGMPIFVYYGTNRAVLDFPDRIRHSHNFDKLSAIERAMDHKLDFRTFFEWYRDQEADEVMVAKESGNLNYVDPSLAHVRKAIEAMMGDVSNLRVKRNPVRLVVDKGGRELRVDLLSDGEKCTLALLGDLARRLILANPNSDNPLEGRGIVLIDEIELHMHPQWQRCILHVLRKAFPNVQFIVTTHSPQVLGEANNDFEVVALRLDENGNGYATPIGRMDGFDSNMILEEYMATPSQSEVKTRLVKAINEAILGGRYLEAEDGLKQLADLSGEDDGEYILCSGYLKRRIYNDTH